MNALDDVQVDFGGFVWNSLLGQRPVMPLEFAQKQALSFVIENRTSDPANPVTGQLWLRTDL